MTSASTPFAPVIYSLTKFDRGAKARWILTEAGVPHTTHWLDRDAREHESTEFLRLNSMGRVPIMKLGDQIMFESGAICTYLADLYADKGLAPALTSPLRGEYLQWSYFGAAHIDTIQQRARIIEDIPPGEVFDKKDAAMRADFADAIEALDRALAKGPFLLGNQFTAADISVSYHLYFCMMWPELAEKAAPYARVLAYLEMLKRRPSAVKAEVFSFEG